MSRIGRAPIEIKTGVEVSINESVVEIKGPKGALSQEIPEGITVVKEDEQILVSRSNELR